MLDSAIERLARVSVMSPSPETLVNERLVQKAVLGMESAPLSETYPCLRDQITTMPQQIGEMALG